MAYYYSAAERAFFSSELMSTDAMPSDKVAVADQAYKQLMADQVAGKLIRTGSGNAPESVDQGLTAATRFGDVSFGKVTGTSLDINGNGDVSGTFVVGGAVTIKGALNAQGGLNVTSITATGTSTLAAVNATNLSLSGTLKVNGASTLQAVSAKKITATEIDLNGSMDASGNVVVHGKTTLEALQANGDATIGGLLKVTGNVTTNGSLTAQNIVSRTGYFGVNTGTKSYYPIAIVDHDENGGFCGYRGFGGMTAIGSGESVAALQTSVEAEFGMDYGSENFFACSDQGIWLLPECNTWENHGTIQIQTNGIYKRLMKRTRGDGDTSTLFLQHFLCDKNGNGSTSRYAGFEANTRNGTQAMIMAYDPRGANTNYASIEVRYSSDGVITTSAPTPPTGDRSTQIATTASFDNEGFIGYKKLTSIQSVKGSFWFDSDSGIDLDDAHLSDIVSGVDWYGIQLGMTRGADKSQYLFNSAGIWRRYSDANLGSETWGDWTQIVNTKGLIAATAPEPVTSSDDNSIATTAWVRALLEAGLGEAIPAGTILPYAGKTVPSGFLAVNGGNVSRTTYARLYEAIGTTWGSGDGSTTFKLPDFRNRTIWGANAASEVGTYLESGAPNITGYVTGGGQGNNTSYGGAFYDYGQVSDTADSGHASTRVVGFDASRSNPIYGNAEIIQPPAGKALWIIKV